ncbi:hypothetical protein ACLESO_03965 [Pyxidicoccus sp. 3LG]
MLRSIIAFALSNVLLLFMFSAGLARRPGEMRDVLQRPALYTRALLVVLVAVPLLALGAVYLFSLPPLAAGAVLLTGVCPGAPLQVRQAKGLGASVTTSLNLLLILALVAILAVPAWVVGIDRIVGLELRAPPSLVFNLVIVKILPPLVVGMAIRHLFPRAADVLAVWSGRIFNVLLVIVAVAVIYLAGPRLLGFGLKPLLAMAVLVSAAAFLGHWAGGPRTADRRAVALAAALANPALTMTIISQSYPRFQALEVTAVVGALILVRLLALVPYKLWVKRHDAHERSRHLPPGSVPT